MYSNKVMSTKTEILKEKARRGRVANLHVECAGIAGNRFDSRRWPTEREVFGDSLRARIWGEHLRLLDQDHMTVKLLINHLHT